MVANHLLGWFKLLYLQRKTIHLGTNPTSQKDPDLANHMWHVSLLTKEEDANLQIWPPLERQSWRGENNRQLNDTRVSSPESPTEPPKDILTWGPIHIGRHQCNEGMFFQLSLHLTWNAIAYHHRFSDARWDTILRGGRKLVCVDSLTSAKALTSSMAKYGRFIIHLMFSEFRKLLHWHGLNWFCCAGNWRHPAMGAERSLV